MLFDLVVGSKGEAWIMEYNCAQNGCAAWLHLNNHYKGGGNKKRKIAKAEAIIEMLHYKNKSVFAFESFSTKLMEAFYNLEGTESKLGTVQSSLNSSLQDSSWRNGSRNSQSSRASTLLC